MTAKKEYAKEKKEFLLKYLKPNDRIFLVERKKTSHYRWYDVYCFYVDRGIINSWRVTHPASVVCELGYDHDVEALKIKRDFNNEDRNLCRALSLALFDNEYYLRVEVLR